MRDHLALRNPSVAGLMTDFVAATTAQEALGIPIRDWISFLQLHSENSDPEAPMRRWHVSRVGDGELPDEVRRGRGRACQPPRCARGHCRLARRYIT